jgi:ABC-2 type transport system permease protein
MSCYSRSACLFYDLTLPNSVERGFTYAWVSVLGITACTLMALRPPSGQEREECAPAIISPIVIVLQFISGVYFVFADLPTWMQEIASLFPLKWMTQGMRSVFLPDSYASQEPTGSWEHGRIALVLLIWCVAGLLVSIRTFCWRSREDG